jgi:putative tryptophan/tyrosine transport system substrate-binding protein
VKRREFITLIGAAATASVAWPHAARAQQGGKLFRIGFVGLPNADGLPERTEAFRAGLRELGYQEGRDVVIEYRWANGDYDRLPALAAELIASKVDLIVTHGTPGAQAARQATTTIPIVVAVVGDAIGVGLVSNLARPGGNITGSTFFQPELSAKRLELLKEAMPNLTEAGTLLNLANPMNGPVLPQMSEVARSLGLKLHEFVARHAADFEAVVDAMAARTGAFVINDDAVLIAGAPTIAKLALQRRLPSIGFLEYASAGGLIAYGVNFPELFRRAAYFVDKILKGAKPGDLPIERATKFETIVNLKTAKALAIELPTSILLRADQVIE